MAMRIRVTMRADLYENGNKNTPSAATGLKMNGRFR